MFCFIQYKDCKITKHIICCYCIQYVHDNVNSKKTNYKTLQNTVGLKISSRQGAADSEPRTLSREDGRVQMLAPTALLKIAQAYAHTLAFTRSRRYSLSGSSAKLQSHREFVKVLHVELFQFKQANKSLRIKNYLNINNYFTLFKSYFKI